MAYEVTAARKRPRSFDEIVGQEFVVATLRGAIEREQIAHAFLFSGPRGVGKTSAARVLARALNCAAGPTPSPCGNCSQCKEILAGSAVDVIEIDGASNTGVDDVRAIRDEVLYPPAAARSKIYIIDEVHMLSNSAFNALLKTIEEPPPYVVFIFATTEIHKVPATIRSRCQQFTFRLFSTDEIRARLAAVAAEMEVETEEEALIWIAKEAGGSLRDAYTTFDQMVSFAGNRISVDAIRDTIGALSLDELNQVGALIGTDSANAMLTLADAIIERGVSVERFVLALADYLRSLLLLKHGVERAGILGYAPASFSAAVRERLSVTQLELACEMLLEVYRNLKLSVSPRFELELLLSRLARLGGLVTADELLAEVAAIKAQFAGDTASAEQPRSRGASATGSSTKLASERPTTLSGAPAGPGTPAAAGADASGRAVRQERPPAAVASAAGAGPAAAGAAAAATGAAAAARAPVRDPGYPPASAANTPPDAAPEDRAGGGDPLLRSLVAQIRSRNLMSLAASLERALGTEVSADRVTVTFGPRDGYSGEHVSGEQRVIAEVAAVELGRPVAVAVTHQGRERRANSGSGSDVERFRKVFRGEVIKEISHGE